MIGNRRFVRSLGIWSVIVGIVLAACTSNTETPPTPPLPAASPLPAADAAEDPDEPAELVVWAEYWTQHNMGADPDGAGQYGRYVKEQFEAEHPGVTVRIEHHGWDESLRQNLFNALLVGSAPDIVVGETYFQFFAELGALVPLDAALGDDKANLIHGTYKAAEYQGQIYGIPAFTGIFALERNCQVVEAAGLDCDAPPTTWDELVAHAEQITEAGDGEYYGYTLQGPHIAGNSVGSVLRIAAYMAQAGAALCQGPDCSEPFFDNPAALPVLAFIREIYQHTPPNLAFEPDEGTIYRALFQGRSAYQLAGSWHPEWAERENCADCRYSSIPQPPDGQPANVVVGNVIYAVLSQSQHPDLATEWVTMLIRDDVQDLVFPTTGRLPTTISALERLRPEVDPATRTFIDELLQSDELNPLPQWDADPLALWTIYNELLTDVMTTERPIPTLMAEAQAAAEQVVAQAD